MPEPNPYPEGSYQHACWELDQAARELGRQLVDAFTPALQAAADAVAGLAAAIAAAGSTMDDLRAAAREAEVRRGMRVAFALVLFMGLLLWVVARGT